MIRGIKRGFVLADEQGDIGTADLFTRIVQLPEKMEWFLREILESPRPVLEGKRVGSVLAHGKEALTPTGR